MFSTLDMGSSRALHNLFLAIYNLLSDEVYAFKEPEEGDSLEDMLNEFRFAFERLVEKKELGEE